VAAAGAEDGELVTGAAAFATVWVVGAAAFAGVCATGAVALATGAAGALVEGAAAFATGAAAWVTEAAACVTGAVAVETACPRFGPEAALALPAPRISPATSNRTKPTKYHALPLAVLNTAIKPSLERDDSH